jgi:hypothetical protein
MNTDATGAIPIGIPGRPESAAWTASLHRVRIVLTESVFSSLLLNASLPDSAALALISSAAG